MPVIKVQTNVVGFLREVEVFLENQRITLSSDGGENFQSTDVIDVRDGKLNIVFHGRGVPTTAWKFTLKQLEPGRNDLFKNEGSIRESGHSLFADFVEIP